MMKVTYLTEFERPAIQVRKDGFHISIYDDRIELAYTKESKYCRCHGHTIISREKLIQLMELNKD